MTDKTIINKLDVSKCEFFTPTEVTVLGGGFETQIYCGQVNEFSDDAFTKNAPNLHCERNPNCNFKQLKRAEQNAKDTYEMWQACIESLNIARQELSNAEQKLEKIKEMCLQREPIENVNTLHDAKYDGMYLMSRKVLQIIERKGNG